MTFVEEAGQALAAIERNVASLAIPRDRARVVRGEVGAVLARLGRDRETFDLVFLDPPYGGDAGAVVEKIAALGLVAPGGFVAAEHGDREVLPGEPGPLGRVVRRAYGRTAITVYKRQA